ncbi:CHAT domain-containing protein [Arthrobacter sp. 162MFSha1.1]|uniref:CHAT domain-containing protein n=1 Tax=Arthrobacter sp. 162MFSha1.1 TaxID=1151119 RepID=UPI0009D9A69E|nr:CHAT domain-containing protein [Arthrobacter sp. 162MFSha1.1]
MTDEILAGFAQGGLNDATRDLTETIHTLRLEREAYSLGQDFRSDFARLLFLVDHGNGVESYRDACTVAGVLLRKTGPNKNTLTGYIEYFKALAAFRIAVITDNGEYWQIAEKSFRQALAHYTPGHFPSIRAEILSDFAKIQHTLYYKENAEQCLLEAQVLLENCFRPGELSLLSLRLGIIRLERYETERDPLAAESARGALELALQGWDRERQPSDWGWTQLYLGILLDAVARNTGSSEIALTAEKALTEASPALLRSDHQDQAARALMLLGRSIQVRYRVVGDAELSRQSEAALRRASSLAQEPATRREIAYNFAILFAERHKWTREHHDSYVAVEIFRQLISSMTADSPLRYLTYHALGSVLSRQYKYEGNLASAREAEHQFRKLLKSETPWPERARASSGLAKLYLQLWENSGDPIYEDRCVAYARRSLAFWRGDAFVAERTPVHQVLAGLHARKIRGFPTRSARKNRAWSILHGNKVLEFWRPESAPGLALQTLTQMSIVEEKCRRRMSARALIDAAIQANEKEYLLAEGDQRRHDLMAQTAELRHRGAYLCVRAGEPRTALEYLENGRAQALLRVVNMRHDPANDADRQLIKEALRVELRKARIAEEQLRGAERSLRKVVGPRRDAALHVHAASRQALRETHEAISNLIAGSQVNAEGNDWERSLEPSDIAIFIAMTKKGAAALLLRFDGSVSSVSLPGLSTSPRSLGEMLFAQQVQLTDAISSLEGQPPGTHSEDTLPDLLQAIDENQPLGWYPAYQLYVESAASARPEMKAKVGDLWGRVVDDLLERLRRDLWLPVEKALPSGTRRVLLAPPLQAALLPLHASAPEDLVVATIPSLHLWRICSARQPTRLRRTFLAASPAKDLRFSNLEAALAVRSKPFSAVGRLLATGMATADAVLSGAGQAEVFHFCGHATYDWLDPFSSALHCYDRPISLTELVTDGDFSGTHLAVLSACETGLPDVFHSGEEFVSFPGALLQAGASSVISSLWPVSDVSTCLLMSKFYEEWASGAPVDAALHNACLWLRNATKPNLLDYVNLAALGFESDPEYVELKKAFQAARLRIALSPLEKPFSDGKYWAAFVVTGGTRSTTPPQIDEEGQP